MKQALLPYITDWQQVRHKDILNQLAEATEHRVLAIGIEEAWRSAMSFKGKLLLIEKGYRYANDTWAGPVNSFGSTEHANKFSYIKDMVDDIIEKVVEHGGDVEFVDKDLLAAYDHIVLIKNFS